MCTKRSKFFSIDAISAKGPFINDVTHLRRVVEHDQRVKGEGTPKFLTRFTEANDEKRTIFNCVSYSHENKLNNSGEPDVPLP